MVKCKFQPVCVYGINVVWHMHFSVYLTATVFISRSKRWLTYTCTLVGDVMVVAVCPPGLGVHRLWGVSETSLRDVGFPHSAGKIYLVGHMSASTVKTYM